MELNPNIRYNFYYWGPYLWRTNIGLKICDEILNRGKILTSSFTDNLASLIDDVKHFNNENDKDYITRCLDPYFDCYLETKKDFATINNVPNLRLLDIWINFQKKGEYNPEHIHRGDLSFVLYLDIPEGLYEENKLFKGAGAGPGCIVFRYGEQSDWAVSLHKFIPEKGDLFIFPSLLSHSANVFKSDGIRVSVSGNFEFI